MTPYYADDQVELYHGVALDLLKRMPDDSIDIIVTSPPFNMGLVPGGNGRGLYGHTTQKASRFTNDGYSVAGDDAIDPDEYAELRRAELAEMWRITRSSIWWNHRPRVIHGELHDPLDGDYGLPLRQRIILHRPTAIDVGLTHFTTRGEYLLVFAKPGFKLVDHSTSGWGDVWRIPPAPRSDHPAPFHQAIPDRCIEATGATSVLDPFAGTGTTLASAKQHGIHGIGIERSERWCRVAAARVGPIEWSATPGSLFEAIS